MGDCLACKFESFGSIEMYLKMPMPQSFYLLMSSSWVLLAFGLLRWLENLQVQLLVKLNSFFFFPLMGFWLCYSLEMGSILWIISFKFWQSTVAVGKYRTKTPEDFFYVFMNFKNHFMFFLFMLQCFTWNIAFYSSKITLWFFLYISLPWFII